MNKELRAEIERLKEDNAFRLDSEKRWKEDSQTFFDLMKKREAEVASLHAENQKLREALRTAIETTHAWGYFDVDAARAALEFKDV